MNIRTIKISRIVRNLAIKNMVKAEETSNEKLTKLFTERRNEPKNHAGNILNNNKNYYEYIKVCKKIDSMSTFEKIKNVFKYLNNFSNIKEAANKILNVANE